MGSIKRLDLTPLHRFQIARLEHYITSTVRVRNGSQTKGCKRCSIITLRLHSHLNHAIQLVLKQTIRLGDIGKFVALSLHSVKWQKQKNKKGLDFSKPLIWSGKRDSVHLLPALYIKQLPLPSTILPIRGTLGLFQGVVFESDFCHTNFRTTVAYDKFTNNF